MKHSKGEWNDNGCGGVWRSGKNWKVADVKAGSGSADMRLILSAPELLEALNCVYNDLLCNTEYNRNDWVQNIKIKVEQAIRKAEGK